MTSITARSRAPLFELKDTSGNTHSLSELLKKGPVVLAFFKVSCPVCQFTFPFLQRIHTAYGAGRAFVIGVSQDDKDDSIEFAREYGVTFPILLDGKGYPVSNDYGLTSVPTVFLFAADGTAKVSSMGFNKADLDKISSELAGATGLPLTPVFLPGEAIPDYKPG